MADSVSSAIIWDAPFLMANAIFAGVLPRDTPRWWVRRRTGGNWHDLIIDDDATEDYYHEKLRMTRCAFHEIIAACAPFLQRRLTHYRSPLLPKQLVAFAPYRWLSSETFDRATSSFGMGRSYRIKAVRDVMNAILSAYPDKICMPTGRWLLQVTRAFRAKDFPNCYNCMDCTHAVHDTRVLWNSSFRRRVEAGTLFTTDIVTLPGGARTTGYVLGDNGYGPLPRLVVPYGGVMQPYDEAYFDTCHKTARNVVERAFGRLKGMWRLFLRHHKTNMDNMPQQFTAVCIIHNLLIEASIDFDQRLLIERDANGNDQPIDLGMHEPPALVSQADASEATLDLRATLTRRMQLLQ
ncbi:hypothetical protein CBR_g50286 [Chara braunii]|uniref:DDE Tnp4 domain-containing protein n=1 Tax=Chara braunii TaxID=69332 RepID=A0A388K5B2_CHABU|nr:hypothetical protein CBR_g50286 [Chara braunii]|eukprot:GBG65244.1 hypothetical protein CBR_g50286 [Chara braunii]